MSSESPEMSPASDEKRDEVREKEIDLVLEAIRRVVPVNWGYVAVLAVPDDPRRAPQVSEDGFMSIVGQVIPSGNVTPRGLVYLLSNAIMIAASGGEAQVRAYPDQGPAQ